MSGYLELANGKRVPVRDGLVLGRVAGCDLVIDDTKASRRHARIIVDAGVVEVEDLDSSNGTLLNGKPVQRRVLRPGDEIRIGQTAIVFVEDAAAGAAPSGSAPAAAGSTRTVQPAADDDVDLFGEPTGSPAAIPAAPPREAAPAAAAGSVAPARPTPPAPPSKPIAPPPPPPPPPPRAEVVEFADEVVEVRKPAAEQRPSTSGRPATTQTNEPDIRQQQRVLQFSKHKDTGNVLGDDLGQMSGAQRALVVALVVALAVGLAWGIVALLR